MSGKTDIKERLRGLLSPVIALCVYAGITPMGITLFGVFLSLVGGWVVGMGRLGTGAVILIISGLSDAIDGSLARSQGKSTTLGAFIDSTGDRVSELVYFIGLVFYFMGKTPVHNLMIFFSMVALAGSFLTSYARARAEGLGLDCSVGVLERPERVALLVFGLVFGGIVLEVVIVVIAVLSVLTFIQRVKHVWNLTAPGENGGDC
ncbi:MAG: CDP-alcohol phosphatidyltransferase family protein [Candidatus Krumholzibacteriota bacterium]|nr:CDP-alcohol phosphatidyltransferase family protein [Candidatus Krumholzibacteriota bacterium]